MTLDIKPGRLDKIAQNVHRITAPNPGLMTGPGTNTYLLGCRQLIIVDPGPDDEQHIAAIDQAIQELAATPQWIFVTHTHPDHSPAAATLSERYNIPVWGNAIKQDGFQDDSFHSDFAFEDDFVLATPEVTIRAVHTPGHVNNHFCFLLENKQARSFLLTGDHIMQGSTVVIIPPAGDMSDYMASLQKLLSLNVDHILPAHGYLIENAHSEISYLLEHRKHREAKVIAAISPVGVASVEMLVKTVYDDVDESLHVVAALSLEAHLIKLAKDGLVKLEEGQWHFLQ